MLLNLGEKIDTLNQAAAFAGTKLLQALADSGITADDWKGAFGLELASLADWPSSAHWPSLLLTLPVIDAAKAGKIVEAVVRGDEDATWTDTKKDGVRYFSKQSAASLVAITPTIAVSNRMLIAGFNPVSVEEAMKRSGAASAEFSDSQTYKAAERLLPEPTNFFCLYRHRAPILPARRFAASNVVNGCGFHAGSGWFHRYYQAPIAGGHYKALEPHCLLATI
jgi:hypothetical protein